jgi:hypothetical protein
MIESESAAAEKWFATAAQIPERGFCRTDAFDNVTRITRSSPGAGPCRWLGSESLEGDRVK